MRLRLAVPADHPALGAVMFDAVRHGPSLYSEAERRAWAPHPPEGAEWSARLAPQDIMLAETRGEILGFVSLAPGGYVDLAYIRPAVQGRGLFRRLHEALEKLAREAAIARLHTHASLMARPAFAAVCYSVVSEESVERSGETLARFLMEKWLSTDAC